MSAGRRSPRASWICVTDRCRTSQHRRTRPERDGAEILDDVVTIVSALMQDQSAMDVGVAVCELVDLDRQVTSDQTLDWLGRDVVGAIAGAVAGAGAVTVSSDVRAGALAEARLGAGRSLDPFLYVSVGTGVSHTLVQAGTPYAGRHGSALVATSGSISAVCPTAPNRSTSCPKRSRRGGGWWPGTPRRRRHPHPNEPKTCWLLPMPAIGSRSGSSTRVVPCWGPWWPAWSTSSTPRRW